MLEEQNIEQSKASLSRRKFLVGTGTFVGGLAAGGLFGIAIPKAEAAYNPAPTIWPWPADGLSVAEIEEVRQRGFDGYQVAGCCYGAAYALIETLRLKVGAPWDTLPTDMFKWGSGGGLGWGTLCGALNGSLAVMNLVVPSKINNMADELMSWYTGNDFPSNLLDGYIQGKSSYSSYVYPNQPTSKSNSPLCHNSVSIWIDTHNELRKTDAAIAAAFPVAKENIALKKARCGKLTGDVAAKAAVILNAVVANTTAYTFAASFNADTSDCMSCHTTTQNDQQGKMNCGDCHDDKLADRKATPTRHP